MSNQERLEKLELAGRLIREVEFSYPIGDDTRQAIFKVVVNTFSFMGSLNPIMSELEDLIKAENKKPMEEDDE